MMDAPFDPPLSPEEARVLGVLIEKALTTPDYYPLTLNALVTACNQKSNRYPVVDYDDATVHDAAESLQRRGLVRMLRDARSTKYRHLIEEKLDLLPRQTSILGVLLLRGPQTVGEIRTRTTRMFAFEQLEDVERVLRYLMEGESPLVARLPLRPGTKEARYAHLLSGQVQSDAYEGGASSGESRGSSSDRVAALEDEVEALRSEVAELREAFATFRQQFE